MKKNKTNYSMKLKIILSISILFGLILIIWGQVQAAILSGNYDFSGNGHTTEYDFGWAARNDYNKFYNYDSSINMSSDYLIGKSVYMNVGVYGEGGASIEKNNCFCIGHGTSQAIPGYNQNQPTYRIETIWDTDMDDNTPPGTSDIYIYNNDGYAEKYKDRYIDNSAGYALAKWAVIAKETQNQTNNYQAYYNGNTIGGYLNKVKGMAISNYIRIDDYAFVEDNAMQEYANRLRDYRFSEVKLNKAKGVERVNGKIYLGPFAIDASKDSNGKDNISKVTATANGAEKTILGFSNTKGGSLYSAYNQIPCDGSEFYVVINDMENIDGVKFRITMKKTVQVIRARTFFFRHGGWTTGGQNLIVYRGDIKNKEDKLELEVTGEEETTTGTLAIIKEDEYTKKFLGGAKFVVQNSKTRKYVKAKQEVPSGDANIYSFTGYANKLGDATVFSTDGGHGIFRLQGLEEGKYHVTEINNPKEYLKGNNELDIYVYSEKSLANLYKVNNTGYAIDTMLINNNIYPEMYKILNALLGRNYNSNDEVFNASQTIKAAYNQEKSKKGYDRMTQKEKNIFNINFVMEKFADYNIEYSGLTSIKLKDIKNQNDANKKKYIENVYVKFVNSNIKEGQYYFYTERMLGNASQIVYNKMSGRVKVYKTSEDNSIVKLKGAKFKIQTPYLTMLVATKDSNGIYNVTDANDVGTIFETNEDGYFEVRGLDEGGDYSIEEIEAPSGYNFVNSNQVKTLYVYSYNRFSNEDNVKRAFKKMFKSISYSSGRYSSEGYAILKSLLLDDSVTDANLKNATNIDEIVDYVLTNKKNNIVEILNHDYTINQLMNDVVANAKSGGSNEIMEEYFAQVYNKYSGRKRTRENVYIMSYAVKALGYDSNVILNSITDQDGNLIVYKTDTKDETKKLSGATFEVKSTSGENVTAKKISEGLYDASQTSQGAVKQFITNTSGYFKILNMETGSYIVKEVQAPYGYEISTSSSKTVKVQKEEANRGWELKDLTKSLATMIWNTKTSDSSTINIADIVEAVQLNSLNSMSIANEIMSKLEKTKVSTYSEISDVVEYLIEEDLNYVTVKVDGSDKYFYKRHRDSGISMIDAIQAIKYNKKVGGTSVSDGSKYLKNYIVQVYNKFTGKNRSVESLYNLKYYSIACASGSEVFANSKDVRMKIKKIDYKTGKGINGIKFAIQCTENNKYLKKQNDGTYTFVDTRYLFTTSKVDGDDGIILLEDIPEKTYKFIEVDTGNTGYILPEYEDERSLIVDRNSSNNKITNIYVERRVTAGSIINITMENVKPKYRTYPPVTVTKQLKVSGKVWKDIPTELKDDTTRDNIYGTNDQLFEGVPVSLVQDGKTVANTTTKANGTYSLNYDLTKVIEQVNNDKDVKRAKEEADNFEARDYTDEIARYNEYIQYYRDDIQAVLQYPNPQLQEHRTQIDNAEIAKYTERINELNKRTRNDDTYHENLCSVYKAEFEEKYNQYLLEYLAKSKIIFRYNGIDYENVLLNKGNIDAGTSSLAEETADDRNSLNTDFGTITGDSNQKIRGKTIEYEFPSDEKVNVKANDTMYINAYTGTNTLKDRYSSLNRKSNNVTEITNINLGVYLRTAPDLSLRKDVYSAEITMNGKTYTYVYGKKDGDTITTIGATFERNMQLGKDNKYLAPVYRADVKDATHNGFTMKVTYRIAVINNSSVLYNKVTKIEDYYSTKYKINAVYDGTKTEKGNKIKDLTDTAEKHVTIDGLNLLIPNAKATEGNAKYIYVDFYVDPISLDIIDKDLELKNIAEISNYSTYSDDKYSKFYGGFDTDSVPNNYKRVYNGHNPKIEDDCDGAPGLKITEAEARKLSGAVFEDLDKDGITGTGKERLGDGIFNSSEEKGISGVEVILEDTSGKKFSATTDSKGAYTISDYPVGTYTLTYKWGDRTYNPLYYKSTIINSDFKPTDKATWYQTIDPNKAYSVAIDDETTRMDIDKNSTTRYEDMPVDSTETVKTMTSKAIQDLEVEMLLRNTDKKEYEVSNIDFGIIERPKQSMKITKNISHIKVTDEYGTVIDESDIENGKFTADKMNFTVYIPKGQSLNPYGQIKTELDKEYLPAKVEATYVIKVENESEVDYFKEDGSGLSKYYKYGTKDVAGESPVKLQVTGVMDYASSAFVISDIIEDNGNAISYDDYIIEDSDYNNKVKELVGTYGATEKTDTTIIERAYDKLRISPDFRTIIHEWATDEKTVKGIFEEWFDENYSSAQQAKTSKLSKNKILELKCLENAELGAGDSKSVMVKGSIPVTSLDSDVLLQNQAEIINIDKTSTFGHKSYETYTTLYDQGEEIKVIPPTGENKDNSNIIVIAISSIVGLLTIGIGIIFIRKKVLK